MKTYPSDTAQIRLVLGFLRLGLFLLLAGTAFPASTTNKTAPRQAVNPGTDEASYRATGLSRSRVEPWEDGLRTSGAPGTYEWWYFDFTMADGSTLVIVYYTKDFANANTGLSPRITVQYDRPGKPEYARGILAPRARFSAATNQCDVRIGPSWVRGALSNYVLHVEASNLAIDLRLDRRCESWRPGTGSMGFNRGGRSRHFNWLPSVPQGAFSGTVAIDGITNALEGAGYHDHNWGDAPVIDLIHDWYWGRAQVGPFTVITSFITANKPYGYGTIPIFMLAKDGRILADDGTKVAFAAKDVKTEPHTGKPVADALVYEYAGDSNRYRVTFTRERTTTKARFIDLLPPGKAFLARLAGFDGAYLRFGGPVTVEATGAEGTNQTWTERSAVWELMYFGHAR